MFTWNEDNGELVLRIERPAHPYPPLLHSQIDALDLGIPYRIEWPTREEMSPEEQSDWPTGTINRLAFDGSLTEPQRDDVVLVVMTHDGSQAILEAEEKRLRAEQIIAQNQALVDQARAKRLAGETLTQQELAAIADLFMFQGFSPQ